MSRFRNRLAKRVMAVILSGAMVMSGVPLSSMTAYASETSTDTGGGYNGETKDDNSNSMTEEAAVEEKTTNVVSADEKTTNVSSNAEAAVKDEDNVSSDKKDDKEDPENVVKESTAADKADDDDADAGEDDKTSETKSSLRAETEETEPEEEDAKEIEDKDEDIREVQAMESGATYLFSAADIDIDAFAGGEVLLKGTKISGETTTEVTGYFALISGEQTEVVSNGKTFYCWDRTGTKKSIQETIAQCINLNGELSAQKNAIKFTTAEAADVTVYWTGSAADSQMSILKDAETTPIETDEATVENGLYVSTVTLDTAGTYYLGGVNPIYKVIVEPASADSARKKWSFRNTSYGGEGLPEFEKVNDQYIDIKGCATDYYGLKIDTNDSTNSAKFTKRDNDVQTGDNTVVRIPVDGRSKITIGTYYGNNVYSFEGENVTTKDALNVENSFTYRGDGKYAKLVFTKGNFFNTVEVNPLSTVKVSGTITLPDGAPSDLKLVFTEDIDSTPKHVAEAVISGNTYEVALYQGASYKITTDKEGYGIKTPSPATVEIAEDTVADITNKDIEVESQDVKTISGNIIFPAGAAIPNDLKLKFTEKGTSAYEEVTVSGGKYEVKLKADTIYTVDATGTKINEYEWDVAELNVTADSSESHITFSKKAVYKVTLSVTSFDKELTEAAMPVTFTHEDGYEYEVTDIDNIQLRNGTYTITKMDVEYPYWFDFSTKFVVEDQAAAFTLNFKERMTWDFTAAGQKKDLMLKENKPNENTSGEQSYHGLLINTNGAGNSGKFGVGDANVQVNEKTVVKIPVSGKGTVKITPATGSYTLKTLTEKDQDVSSVDGQTGSIAYTEGDAYVLFEASGLVWLEKIEITREAESGEGEGSTDAPEPSETDPDIERPETFPTEWDFMTGKYTNGGVDIGANAEGTLDGLKITTGAGGKFTTDGRNDWVQANTNTTLKIPVKDASKITTTWYYGTETYEIDGQEATGNSTIIVKGTGGWATLEITNGGYLGSIKVQQLPTVKVSGDVTLPNDAPSGIKVIFTEKTDRASKFVREVPITDGKYETELYCTGEKYAISLSDENYNITVPAGAVMDAVKNDAGITQDITAEKIETSSVTGDVIFPTGKTIPTDLKLTFTEKVTTGTAHVVEDVAVTNGKYTARLKLDTVYTITARGTGVDDFEVKAPAELDTAATNKDIEFVEKTKYEVKLAVTSFDDDAIDLSKIDITFTNTEDENYTYTFKGTDKIELRDGTYAVRVKAEHPYVPDNPAQLTINKAAADYALHFIERTEWNFRRGQGNGIRDITEGSKIEGATGTFAGLEIDATAVTDNVRAKFDMTSNDDWAQVNIGTIIKVPVKGPSEIALEFYSGTEFTVDGAENETSYTYSGAAGYVTIVITKGGYLGYIKVKAIEEVVIPTGPRKIDVWDFGGKEETDTDKYENHITVEKWVSANAAGAVIDTTKSKPEFKQGETSFDDLTITHVAGDRLISTLGGENAEFTKLLYSTSGSGGPANTYEDYESVGAWYCAGDGTQTSRSITIKNVIAGDTIVVYAGQHSSGSSDGPLIFYYEGQGLAKAQKGSVIIGPGRVFEKIEFIAEYTGSYTIWPVREEKGNNGKAMYHRVMRIPGTKVSGSIDFGDYTGSGHTVKFINQTTKQEFVVDVKEDNSFEQFLAPGYTYLAVLNGAPGYGFAAEGKTITIAKGASEINNVRLSVEAKDMCTYTGKFNGFAPGYNVERLSITLTAPKDSNADNVDLTIDKEALSFTAELEKNLEYTIQMEGVDDYVVKAPLTVTSNLDQLEEDITVELKPMHAVTGGFIGLKEDAEVTKLSFTLIDEKGREDNNYVYDATVVDGGYSIRLRDGAYAAKATVTGYTTQAHVVVNGEDVYEDLMFVSTATEGALERAANLYVGYPGKKNNFNTVSEAVKAAKRMPTPTSEAQRITIHIAPGTYREQIIVNVPYITFTNDEPSKGNVLLTWYYGVGYAYYSAKNGYYDEERAHDKYEKGNADRWGCAVRVAASDFRAENIVFENSFSRYITEEEIADGVELRTEGTDSGATYVRRIDSTVAEIRSKATVERAAAIALDADRAEFYKCEFYGSQDTVYTGSGGVHSYFKDCFIEGNTDFLFGDSNSVYENCKLSFAGYSVKAGETNKDGGLIAVNQAGSEHGYLFWGCTITRGEELNNGFGNLGRPWRANARVTYVNTIQESEDLISESGWSDMSGASAADNPNYAEYNTTLPDGTPITIKPGSVRAMKYKTENPVSDKTVFFDGWTPAYLTYDDTKVVREPVSSERRTDVPTGTTITLSCDTEGAKIYYTVDGEDPTGKDSELYTDGEKISLGNEEKTVVVKAIAKTADATSNLAVFEYTVKSPDNLIAEPTATVTPGEVPVGTSVRLNCVTEGAVIYYTTDGSDPTAKNELRYRGQAIIIDETKTIKAIAVKDTNESSIVSFAYMVKPTIAATPGDGTAFPSTGGTVTLTASKGAEIYYTTSSTQDGLSDPADESNTQRVKYTDTPIQITEETYIWAVAVSGNLTSDAIKYHYTVLEAQAPARPIANQPDGAAVTSGSKITLTAENGAEIRYITDSEPISATPDSTSTLYTDGIVITEEIYIKAIAIKDGKSSEVLELHYYVLKEGEVASPTADPLSGSTVEIGDSITLSAATDADIYFRINGDPLDKSDHYETPIIVDETMVDDGTVTINAYAEIEGNKSRVVSFIYTIKTGEIPAPNPDEDDPGEDKEKIQITGLKASYDYTGAKIIPDIKVWDCDIKGGDRRLLTVGVDYTVTYKNNVKPGTDTAEVIVTGKGNYVGKDVTEKFSIKEVEDIIAPVNVKGAKIDKISDITYTGAAHYPDFTMTLKNQSPVTYKYNAESGKYAREDGKDMDINVAVSNNINKGTATILVSGEKDAKGKATSVKKTFKILAVDFSKATDNEMDINVSGAEYAIKGAVPASLTVKYKGTLLKAGRDYTVKYGNNKKAGGEGTVTITGKGNYAKKYPKQVTFPISQLNMENLTVCAITAYDNIDASKIKATIVDKDNNALKASQYTLMIYKAAEGTDTYGKGDKLPEKTKIYVAAEAKDKTNLTGMTPRAEFTVGIDISKAKFAIKKGVVKSYTGSEVKLVDSDLTVTIKGAAEPLKMGTDYEIAAYSNNINKGTATAVVRGIGNYSGTKTIKFKITQKTMVKGTTTVPVPTSLSDLINNFVMKFAN